VPATVFTYPEVAAVGVSQTAIDDGTIQPRIIMLPLKTMRERKCRSCARASPNYFAGRTAAW
jgi:pyruvate/2-oxoglutarate dehydrogenase complex dihydrolipoamide dehydrogenase (E3) component